VQREKIAQTMARWKTPGLKKAYELWLDYLEVAYEDRSEEARELAKQELVDAALQTQSKAEAEAERRIEMCKRVVKRMLQHQLCIAWGQFVDCILTTIQNRETVGKVLARMTHRQLVVAFDCYAGAVGTLVVQREMIAQTMARWKTPVSKKVLEFWVEYVEISVYERNAVAQVFYLFSLFLNCASLVQVYRLANNLPIILYMHPNIFTPAQYVNICMHVCDLFSNLLGHLKCQVTCEQKTYKRRTFQQKTMHLAR